ncbi:MAG: pyrroloquinoline quinone biosynthesis protein PqqE [Actinomycetota bacterium]|nr:pyrroloquinoline quinone biosynthesis protein PqqE [Actinomycetota bacterium]
MSLVAEVSYRCPLRCPYCSNPTSIGDTRWRRELTTDEWVRVMREAAALGVLQVGLTGGEPLVRGDLEKIVAAAAAEGLYTTLVTAATTLSAERARRLQAAGLDHVQISVQDTDAASADALAGAKAHARKLEAARMVRELGLPLTINAVLHRRNLDRVEAIIDLAAGLGADRLELANTQFYGWAVPNQAALMPTSDQLRRAEEAVARARERLGARPQILYVLSDFFEDLPKPCMGGWGRTTLVVAPNGEVLPCHAASAIPGLEFANVTEHPLEWIWSASDPFTRFRGTDWMQEPCRTCPLGRQEVDFGGCRCQALRLVGDAAATDPVCRFSPHHQRVETERQAAQDVAFVPRVLRRHTGR